jgi:urease subunit alpha
VRRDVRVVGRRSVRLGAAVLGTRRALVPVRGVRGLTRASLHANRAVPQVEIDVVTGAVSLGGRALDVAPVSEVPPSRRFLLR